MSGRSLTRRLAALVLAAGAVAGACGGDGSTSTSPPRTDDAAFVRFDPLGGELRPFPSDLYTVADPSRPLGRRIAVDTTSVPVFVGLAGDHEMDGFDVNGRLMLGLSEPPDESSLPSPGSSAGASSPIVLTIADPESDGFGEPVPFLVWLEPLGAAQKPPSAMLMIRALAPLRPATRYALVVKRSLRASAGASFGRSATTKAILEDGAVPDALAGYAAVLRSTVEELTAPLGISVDDVAAATVFTTASDEAAGGGLVRLVRNEILSAADRTPRFVVDTVGDDDGDSVVVRGHIDAYEFRREDQTFDLERFAGYPVNAPRVSLEAVLMLPRAARRAPVVLYGHGINSSKNEVHVFGRGLARRGIATIAIDFVEHGSRYTGSVLPALSFLSVDWIPGGRDNARQTVADLVQLARTVETDLGSLDLAPIGAPDGVPDVDGSRIGYLGVSFGAILGSMFATVDPAVRAAALLVGGGTWTDIAFGFPPINEGGDGFGTIAGVAELLELPVSDVLTLMAVGQSVFAPGDPLTFARWLEKGPPMADGPRQARSVLQVEVIDDQVVNNKSNEALARAIGVPLVTPIARAIPGVTETPSPITANVANGTTAGLVQYHVYQDGSIAEHDNIGGSPEVKAQAEDFLASVLLEERAPSISAPAQNAR